VFSILDYTLRHQRICFTREKSPIPIGYYYETHRHSRKQNPSYSELALAQLTAQVAEICSVEGKMTQWSASPELTEFSGKTTTFMRQWMTSGKFHPQLPHLHNTFITE